MKILCLWFLLITGLLLLWDKASLALIENYCGSALLKAQTNEFEDEHLCFRVDSKQYKNLQITDRGKSLLGVAFYWQGMHDEAKSMLTLVQNPSTIHAAYWLGRIYFEEGEISQAIESWKEHKEIGHSLWYEARRLEKLKDFDNAIKLYEIGTRLLPNEFEVWREYGWLLWSLKFGSNKNYFTDDTSEFELVIKKTFETILSLDSTYVDGLNWLGWYHYKVENNFIASQYYLLEAIKHGGGNDPWINYHLGKIYEDNQDMTNALIYYNAAYINRPEGDILIPGIYAQILARTGNIQDAIYITENELLVLDPKNPVNYLRLVLYYSNLCETNKAKEIFEAAQELSPESHIALYNKAKEELNNLSTCK